MLSLTALLVAAWILSDFAQELESLKQLSEHLPRSDMPEVSELAGELRFQSQLSLALILITIASACALTLLVRAYLASESTLRETRVLATDILASIDQGIITTDHGARILSVNPTGEVLLGVADRGARGAPVQFPDAHAKLSEICRRVLESRQAVRDQDYVVVHGGHSRTLRAGCSLLRDPKQRLLGAVIHVRDVTEKELMEQRLRRMERYMSLATLAVGLQHEIKNPLSALALHAELLSEAVEEQGDFPELQSSVDVLRQETLRITRVLESFRDFASIEKLSRSNHDLLSLLRQASSLVKPQAAAQNVRIDVDARGADKLVAFVDPVRIEQVLLNLMLNSLAAMPGGGELRLCARRDDSAAVLDVVDTGSGIPGDLQDKIFDPYFTTRGAGTGMGLAICEKIVSQHSGGIEFETGPSGTRFTITLPIDEPRDA